MADLRYYPLRFDKGANTTDEATILGPGECSVLENWEPTGAGLRPRASWRKGGGTATAPASRRVRGISADLYVSGARKILAGIYDNSTELELWVATGATPDAITGWTVVKANVTDAAYRGLPICFAAGHGKVVYANPGFPSHRARSWDGTSETDVGTDDTAGRFLLYHLNRFWTGGTNADPTLLRFSGLNDETDWDFTENFIPVARDDGEPIEDAVIFDRGLVVGKAHSLWWLSGLTPDSFGLYPIAQGNISVAQGRSLCASPLGVFVVGRDGGVWLWTGGTPELVNRKFQLPVQASGYVTTAWQNERLYVCQSGGADVAVYDPAAKAWWAEPHVAPTTEGPQEIAAIDEFLVAGAVNATTNDLLQYRRERGALAVGTARSPVPDEGQGSTYAATARPDFPKDVLGKFIVRELRVRYRQFSDDDGGFTATAVTDKGTSSAKTFGNQGAVGVYVEKHTFGVDGNLLYFEFASSPNSSTVDTYAIEEALVGVQVPEGRQ